MQTYTFKGTTHEEVLAYLKTRPFDDVKDMVASIDGEATKEYSQDDVIKIVTYMINRPYYEVFKIANKLVNIDESSVAPEAPAAEPVSEEPKA